MISGSNPVKLHQSRLRSIKGVILILNLCCSKCYFYIYIMPFSFGNYAIHSWFDLPSPTHTYTGVSHKYLSSILQGSPRSKSLRLTKVGVRHPTLVLNKDRTCLRSASTQVPTSGPLPIYNLTASNLWK